MLRGVRAGFFNDPTCNRGHHFPCTNPSWGWSMLMCIAQERHIISVICPTWCYGSPSGYDIAGRSVNQRFWTLNSIASCSRKGVLIFVLALDLLGSLVTSAIKSLGTLACASTSVIDKLCHSNSLLRALSIDHAHIHTRAPVIHIVTVSRLGWLTLASPLFLLQLLCLVTSIALWWETIIIAYLIFDLLHVVASTSIDPLRVSIILSSFVWIVASIAFSSALAGSATTHHTS